MKASSKNVILRILFIVFVLFIVYSLLNSNPVEGMNTKTNPTPTMTPTNKKAVANK